MAKLILALKFSILVKNRHLKTVALHAFLFIVLKFSSTPLLSEASSSMVILYLVLLLISHPAASFERFVAAGELFKLLFSGLSLSLQLSHAVRSSTSIDVEVEVPGHVTFCCLKELNPCSVLH